MTASAVVSPHLPEAARGRPLVGARVFMLLLNAPYYGSERLMVRTAAVLRDAGADVLVATCDWEFGGIRRELQRCGVAYTDILMRGMFTRRGGIRRVTRVVFEAVRSAFRVRRAARRFSPTHIVIPDEANFLYALPLLVGRGAVAAVYVPANVPDEARATASALYRLFLRRVVGALVDTVVANSAFTARAFRRRLPAGQPIAVVPCCLPARDTGDPEPVLASIERERRFTVVYIGQLAAHKGVDLLVDAALTLIPRHPQMDVIIAGPGDDRASDEAAWRSRVAARGLTERIRFIGPVQDVPRLLASAAVHVMPSRCDESFGLVVLEAKNARVPSVVFPVGALPELVRHAVDGYVCREVSADAVAEGIEFFMEPQRRSEAAHQAWLSAADYSFERFEHGWVQVLSGSATMRHS